MKTTSEKISAIIMTTLVCWIFITVIHGIVFGIKANALEIKLNYGHAVHFDTYKHYNDSVFKDSRTSTNLLIQLKHNNYSVLGIHDSMGYLSFALIHEYSFSKRFSLISGLYILRNDKLPENNALLLYTPSFNVGNRNFSITPLVGIQHSLPLTDAISLDTLVTPAFVLVGLSIKVGL